MAKEDKVFSKCAWRLIPFMALLYVVSIIDRTNVGFAALTMNRDLGYSPTVFGFGAGTFFLGYSIFQVPANMILQRLGAKRWVFCILACWGFLSAANALVRSPASFYILRFLLGVAEAGLFPGMILYLTYWFPPTILSRCTANFLIAIPVSNAIGAPFSSLILEMNGVAGLHGWQWLFLIEGLPAFLLSFAVLKFLPDDPSAASWLNDTERKEIGTRLVAELPPDRADLSGAVRDVRVLALGLSNFFYQAGIYGFNFWLPQIVRSTGFSNLTTGFVVAIPYTIGAGALILGGYSSSARRERILHVALPWLLAGLVFAVAGSASSPWVELVALTIAIAAAFFALGPFFSLPSSFLCGTALAGGIGLWSMLGSLGGFFGPSLLGLLKQASGQYGSGIVAVGIAFAIGGLIVLVAGRWLVPSRAADSDAPQRFLSTNQFHHKFDDQAATEKAELARLGANI